MSFGCVGMRINIGAAEDLLLMAVPRKMLDDMHADFTNMGQLHRKTEKHHKERITSLGMSGPEKAWG